ncbi:uncharacterized protein N7479_010522 [Penicillium vulpinum]|uniref:Uncharacterized protein n=1 Tax=Penicillium vulpinum TaxID=29845 RepID=A0A1V6S977_9EURO|nr:uncharacterized protein N7479_010522 [Penicillium vulpinum]KAJ5952109.1 hypothetical protein N7479_010522 [Penicillium vulpinum]OQE10289.1 hypothetical protein PENVUL_c004G02342 [Penicillium vulpinum]
MARTHMVSVSGVNPYPNCLLCGVEISNLCPRNVDPTRSDILFKENKWKHYRKAKLEHVMVPSKEVEEAYLAKFPDMWSCMCRAILKGPGTKYSLSGITAIETSPTDPYIIPKNPSMARIGGKRRNIKYDDDTFTQFYAASIKKQLSRFKGENIGFVVHAHCWALLDRIISTTLVERKMEKFIRAARKYWRDHELWGIYDCLLGSWKYSGSKSAHPGFEYGCDIFMNPFIVPEVQKAIDNARKTKKKQSQRRGSNVPLEVAIMIAEWTCPIDYTPADVMNTRNMLSAWQWILPDWFWKRRLEEAIFVELKSLREASDSIDWQGLRLDLMALVSDQEWYSFSGLANRERVLSFMTAIKSNFLDMS